MSKDTGSRKIVLLIDDDEIHLTITELSLQDNYEVFMVKSGAEALEFLTNGDVIPDLMMLDILMPEMDGWVVFDKIQDIAAHKFTPIMFFTSMDEESAREKAYELGAFDFVIKPCDQPDLQERIKIALEKAELQKQQFNV